MEIPLADLAGKVGGTLEGGPGDLSIRGVAGLEEAQPGEIAFVANPKYLPLVQSTRASALIAGLSDPVKGIPVIRVRNADLAFSEAATLFAPPLPVPPAGIHPTAVVDKTARVNPSASVGPYAVIESGCRVGDRSVVGAHVYLGAASCLGNDCRLYPGVIVRERAAIGDRVILHSGVVIGADGFGYVTEKGVHTKIPQLGTVQIDDDVEIGANTTVDRARFGKTWIQKGVKIDNLVQVAHNVVIGEHTLVVAQSGFSGSARVGRHVVLGGQSGVLGHLWVGDGTLVAARSVVTKDAAPGSRLSGNPAGPHEKQQRIQALVRRLPEMRAAIRELAERMDRLDKATAHHRA